MNDLERQKKNFKNHIATLTNLGNIKILDFKNPESSDYRIRFLFEEDYYKLHISGDLGELTATNCRNMRYDGMQDFIDDLYYFESKVDCHSRDLYYYDEDVAREKLQELFNEYDIEEFDNSELEFEEKYRISNIDKILDGFDDSDKGLSNSGQEVFKELFSDAGMDDYDIWCTIQDMGKTRTGIIELYMLAFKLAKEQLNQVVTDNA